MCQINQQVLMKVGFPKLVHQFLESKVWFVGKVVLDSTQRRSPLRSSQRRDAVKIIDISRETTFQDVCRLLKSSDAKECSSVWFLEFPEDRMSDNVKFNLILSEKDWQKALSEFHFSRRSMRLKALEDFLRLAIEGTQTESVSNRLEAFQRCTEICAYEDLHSQLPALSTLEAACTAILESDSIDLKNSASHFLWCAVSFSSEFRSYLETSGLLASIVKNSSLFTLWKVSLAMNSC